MLLFFVRHGDPIYNPDSLTELGKQQAEALVKRMIACKPERIFSSSSTRALMTAEPTAKALHKEIEILDWCHEDHAGRELSIVNERGNNHWLFYHQKTRKIFASPEMRKLDKEWYKYPGYEKYEAGIKRIQTETDKLMLSLGYEHDHDRNGYIPIRHNNDRIALFAHQGFGLAFLSCLLDIPYPQMTTHFDMGHTGMTVIEFGNHPLVDDDFILPLVLQLSNDSHIFASETMETKYQNRVPF